MRTSLHIGGNQASADAMKVLVVEDDPFVREMAMAGLEDAGFEAIEAASGGEALRLLHAGIAVDALVTDIRLRAERLLHQHSGAGIDGGERGAQIVAKHGDDLLAQFRSSALV
jgi:CheY-like chemotaxis protein